MEKFIFPKNFYFGTATSAYQVEGDNHNDWTEWEEKNAKRKAQNAKLKEWPEYILKNYPNPLQEENYTSGKACDHYNRFREDFDIAKQLGHSAHRLSIEWSRIEPEEGKFNESEIEHYRQVIKALREPSPFSKGLGERGIEPFVTLWHFTLPNWVYNQGGWENEKTIHDFIRFALRIMDVFKDSVRFWLVLNEPTVYAGYSYLNGKWPPNVKSYFRANHVLKNLIKAQRKLYFSAHERFGGSILLGTAHNIHYHLPYRKHNLFDKLASSLLNYFRDFRFLGAVSDCQDFIGLNHYFRDCISFRPFGGGKLGFIDIINPNVEVSDMGWDIFPEGIYHIILQLKKFNIPIYITENGIADSRDEKRAKFIEEHLRWVAKAMREGGDIRGYFYWSLMDNFEWDKGLWPRFGLVEVDYKTMERKIRLSAWKYKEIIENGFIL